ncbi:hypothetical protein [Streptacidiphilus rugosus]|uniref:hypothetical protein n=1 Tax=Streptacidiphilus rugosus TaxID=405783 RepID=UPI000692127B|nr:hypothetical protein [Streptacidiphilus rugosus]
MGDASLAARVAERLDYLMRTGHPDGGGPTDYAAVAEASHAYAREHGGPTISHQGVFNLRNAKTANPSVNSLEALAHVYGVDITYFLAEPDQGGDRPAPTTDDAGAGAADPEAVLGRLLLLVSIRERRDLEGNYGDKELARLVQGQGGHLTEDDIVRLRGGEWQPHLTARLTSFATASGVPAAFFFDDEVAARVSEDLKLLSALRDIGARQVAMRMVELDPEDVSAIRPMIEHLISRKKS